MRRDPDGDAGQDRFARLLDGAASRPMAIRFWWRDDDAQAVTPELQQLLAMSSRFSLPLGLAVIPKSAGADLAARVHAEQQISVLQHGWQHKRHSPAAEKKMELGDHRPLPAVLGELRAGRQRLAELVPALFLPVLVPPWNRISPEVSAARREIGLLGLSLFGRNAAPDPHCVNTHVDIIDWTVRAAKPRAAVYALLCREVERRLDGDPEPLGLLTHHLVHDEANWGLLGELFTLLAGHPAAVWPSVPDVFGLTCER